MSTWYITPEIKKARDAVSEASAELQTAITNVANKKMVLQQAQSALEIAYQVEIDELTDQE